MTDISPTRLPLRRHRARVYSVGLIVLAAAAAWVSAGTVLMGQWLPWALTLDEQRFLAVTLAILLTSIPVYLHFIRLPYSSPIGVGVFVTLITLFFTLLTIAVLRTYYSRPLVMALPVFMFATLMVVSFIAERRMRPRIAFVGNLADAQYPDQVLRKVVPLDELSSDISRFDVLVVHFEQELTPGQQRIVSQALLAHMPVLQSLEFLEHEIGRVRHRRIRSMFSLRGLGRAMYRDLKHLLDCLAILALAPLWLPLMAVIAAAIWLEDGDPVVFVQKRVGLGARPFRIFKFRTMRASDGERAPQFAHADSDRITRVGRLIRKLRLDEMPQFFNVLNGTMSLVGPRPEQVPFAEEYRNAIPYYELRHTVRPGITGWAQIMQGYAASAEETETKLEYDLYYVRNMSLSLDIYIVVRTVWIVLTSKGAV